MTDTIPLMALSGSGWSPEPVEQWTMTVSARFLARDSMLSALYAIANPSVRPSVRHTGGSVKNG